MWNNRNMLLKNIYKYSPLASFPFLPELHDVLRPLGKLLSAHVFPLIKFNYANIKRLEEHRYMKIPQMEESLAAYLSFAMES